MNEASIEYWKHFLRLSKGQVVADANVVAAHAGNAETSDGLIALYFDGKKTAGSSLVDDFKSTGEALPQVGNYWIMLDSQARPKCIGKTIRVEIHKFKDVPERIAIAEGEGDLSLEHWRQVHRAFYTPFLTKWGIFDLDEAEVITEHFELVFRS